MPWRTRHSARCRSAGKVYDRIFLVSVFDSDFLCCTIPWWNIYTIILYLSSFLSIIFCISKNSIFLGGCNVKIYNIGNGRQCEFRLSLFTMTDLDDLIRKNFRRILDQHKLQQNTLAESIDKKPSEINDILAGRKPMGKDTMTRICKKIGIDPWEFYWTEKLPIIKDETEREALDRYRREQVAGVAEDVAKYGEFRILEAKKKSGTSREDAQPRVKRTRKKAG